MICFAMEQTQRWISISWLPSADGFMHPSFINGGNLLNKYNLIWKSKLILFLLYTANQNLIFSQIENAKGNGICIDKDGTHGEYKLRTHMSSMIRGRAYLLIIFIPFYKIISIQIKPMSRRFLTTTERESPQKVYEKRRRIPSKYAEHIDDFKKGVVGSIKKLNNHPSLEEFPLSQNQIEIKKDKPSLTCKLPSGKVYNLDVVVTPHKKIIKEKKSQVIKAKEVPSPTSKQPKKEEQNLLLHFLVACQELKDAIEWKNGTSELDQENNGSINKNLRKYSKVRREKDEEEKVNSYYDKLAALNQKFAIFQQKIVTI